MVVRLGNAEGRKPSLQTTPEASAELQSRMALSAYKNACFCGNLEKAGEVFFMCRCKNMAHKSCMPWRPRDFGDFECTGCTILSNDPLNEVLEVLLEPSLLASAFTYTFKLKINDFESLNADASLDVEIRCIKMDGEHFFEQSWPDKAQITVNGCVAKTVLPLVPNSSLKKRRDEKLTISNPKIGTNRLTIVFENVRDGKNTKVDKDPLYTVAVVLIRRLSADDLANKILASNTLDVVAGQRFISDRFVSGRDVKISEMKADLDCKISFTPIVHPARGKHCTHLNCFSLVSFLKSMEASPWRNWSCPLCRKPCYRLVVDKYMEAVIAQAHMADPSRREVFFRKDGSVVDADAMSEITSITDSRLKHSAVKSIVRQPEPEILILEEDGDAGLVMSARSAGKCFDRPSESSADGRSAFDLNDDLLLGKRQPPVDSNFLDDLQFLRYLHGFARGSLADRLEQGEDLRHQQAFSLFEARLRSRMSSDLLATRLFETFYSLVMKQRSKAKHQRPTKLGDLYNNLLTDLRQADGRDAGVVEEREDLLRWMLRMYEVDCDNARYLLDRLDDDRDSTVC